MTSASDRWAADLAAWEIDPQIIAAAPESPYGFPPAMWSADRPRLPGEPPSRTVQAAREALPAGGSVLDIGCGGGAGSVALADVAGRLVGVDDGPGMLETYEAAARRAAGDRPMEVRTVAGRWPDVAGEVEPVDVVVAAHVVYNVPDLRPFLEAATACARRRVVLELTVAHPQVAYAPLWRAVHGQDRPDGPRLAGLLAVAAETGARPVVWRWDRAPFSAALSHDEHVAWVRRRLCVGPARDGEIAAMIDSTPAARQDVLVPSATVWWDVA